MANEAIENAIAIQGLFRNSVAPVGAFLRSEGQRRQDVILRQGRIDQSISDRNFKRQDLENEFRLKRELAGNELTNRRALLTSELSNRRAINQSNLENAIALGTARNDASILLSREKLAATREDADINRDRAIDTSEQLQEDNFELIRLRDSQVLSPDEKDSSDRQAALEAGINMLPSEIARIDAEAAALRLQGDADDADELLAKNGLDPEKIGEFRLLVNEGRSKALKAKTDVFQSLLNRNNVRIISIAENFGFAPSIVPNSIAPTQTPAAAAPAEGAGGPLDLTGTGASGPAANAIVSADQFLAPEFLAREQLEERGSDPDFLAAGGATNRPGTVVSRFFGRPFTDPKRAEAEQKAFEATQQKALDRASQFEIGDKKFTLKQLVDKAVTEGDSSELEKLFRGALEVLDTANVSPNRGTTGADFLRKNFGGAIKPSRRLSTPAAVGPGAAPIPFETGGFDIGTGESRRFVETSFTFTDPIAPSNSIAGNITDIAEETPQRAPRTQNSILQASGF